MPPGSADPLTWGRRYNEFGFHRLRRTGGRKPRRVGPPASCLRQRTHLSSHRLTGSCALGGPPAPAGTAKPPALIRIDRLIQARRLITLIDMGLLPDRQRAPGGMAIGSSEGPRVGAGHRRSRVSIVPRTRCPRHPRPPMDASARGRPCNLRRARLLMLRHVRGRSRKFAPIRP